jgi:hypothetical protein
LADEGGKVKGDEEEACRACKKSICCSVLRNVGKELCGPAAALLSVGDGVVSPSKGLGAVRLLSGAWQGSSTDIAGCQVDQGKATKEGPYEYVSEFRGKPYFILKIGVVESGRMRGREAEPPGKGEGVLLVVRV